jgi:hypothetical protein
LLNGTFNSVFVHYALLCGEITPWGNRSSPWN